MMTSTPKQETEIDLIRRLSSQFQKVENFGKTKMMERLSLRLEILILKPQTFCLDSQVERGGVFGKNSQDFCCKALTVFKHVEHFDAFEVLCLRCVAFFNRKVQHQFFLHHCAHV